MARKVSAGQKISQNPLVSSAGTVNNTLDAVGYFQNQMALGGGVGPKDSFPQPCFVKVKNNSGGDLARGKVLQLGTFLLTAKQNAQLWFNADTPEDPLATARCCILRKPLPDGDIGDGQIAGVCIASIDVSDDTHTHASPADSASDLASGTSGPFEVLSALSGTGVQEAVVRFIGGASLQFIRIKGLTTAAVSGGSTFNIDGIGVMQGADPRTDTSSSSETVTVQNRLSEHADDDAYCEAVWDESTGQWVSNHLDSICPPSE